MKPKTDSTEEPLPLTDQPEESQKSLPDFVEVDLLYSEGKGKDESATILAFILYYLLLIIVVSLFDITNKCL